MEDQLNPMKKFQGQDYKEIRRALHSSGELFRDPEFPASNHLLSDRSSLDLVQGLELAELSLQVTTEGQLVSDPTAANQVEWLRPLDICEKLSLGKEPELFVGTVDRFHVKQGEVGDCWFLAALTNLAGNRERLARVVPDGQSFDKDQYAGIFRFCFWRFGEWVEVVVDDLLPTRNGRLIYLHSGEDHEFWGALLEKAYAKIHGSYHLLNGGFQVEAAIDFTGGIPERVNGSTFLNYHDLFRLLNRASSMGAFMGSSLKPEVAISVQLGLIPRHAYSITAVVEVNGHKLVRARNPWGNDKEWRGEWCDWDTVWLTIPQETKDALKFSPNQDGEFFMSFEHFLYCFGEVDICYMRPEDMGMEEQPPPQAETFEVAKNNFGQWKIGETDGGCGNDSIEFLALNPQYFFDLNSSSNSSQVVISLSLQKRPDFHMGFKVFKCPSGTDERLTSKFLMYPIAKTTFTNCRDLSLRMNGLSPGRYCVVPCTFERGQEANFLLRIFVEKQQPRVEGPKTVVIKPKEEVEEEEDVKPSPPPKIDNPARRQRRRNNTGGSFFFFFGQFGGKEEKEEEEEVEEEVEEEEEEEDSSSDEEAKFMFGMFVEGMKMQKMFRDTNRGKKRVKSNKNQQNVPRPVVLQQQQLPPVQQQFHTVAAGNGIEERRVAPHTKNNFVSYGASSVPSQLVKTHEIAKNNSDSGRSSAAPSELLCLGGQRPQPAVVVRNGKKGSTRPPPPKF